MIRERTVEKLEPRFLAPGDCVLHDDRWFQILSTQKRPQGWLCHLRAGDDERIVQYGIFARISVKRWSEA